MSDTDDTDVLLLIPPDFFLINSDTDESVEENWNEHCRLHCDLVENLVGEVGDLKNRLNCIESFSISSSIYSMDRVTESDMSSRNFQFTEDFKSRHIPYSTNSTPQKPKTKLVINSLPSTPSTERDNFRRPKRYPNYDKKQEKQPQVTKKQSSQYLPVYNENDADISSFTSSPEKRDLRNKDVLGEIDQFLSHVKNIKRFEASRKIENDFPPDREPQSLPISFDNSPLKLSDLKGEGDFKFDQIQKRKGLDLKDVDQLIQCLEEQQQKMEKVPITNRIVEGNETQTRTWKPGENKSSVPNYNYGIRDDMYPENLGNIDDFLKQNLQTNHPNENDNDSDTTNDTPPTVFEKKAESFLLKKPQNELTRFPTNYLGNNLSVFDYVTKSMPQHQHFGNTSETHSGKSRVLEDVMKKTVQSNVQAAPVSKRTMNEPQSYDAWKKSVSYPRAESQQIYFEKFEEERMRRQHCEKLIQELQLKHLEMQQRLAVAVQVDCAKDAAILKFHKAWEKVADRWGALETERNQLSQKLNNIKEKSEQEIAEAKKKVIHYETEMSKALDLAHKNQEKINTIEFEKDQLIAESETIKKEVETLKTKLKEVENERDDLHVTVIKLENSNQLDQNLVSNLQKELASQKQKYQNDISSFEKELKYLREEKGKLEKEIKDANGACNVLETKNKSLENIVDVCKKSEKHLQQEINKLVEQQEKAKMELRNFYQQQVELLVKDKLKEFQNQLEQTEKSLHEELQVREQNIAKTAAKQLQKFTDKHQVEIQLLEQKHKEEINLYEIQIQQFKHVITTQQTKLDHLQLKRNNIAQELKSVMEAQWSEALRIIDNGKTPQVTPTDPKDMLRYQQPEQEKQRETTKEVQVENVSPNIMVYATPRTSRETKDWHDPQNNDLQKYIKMLLDKEPGNPTEGTLPSNLLRSSSARDCIDVSSHPEVSEDVEHLTDRKTYSTVSKEQRAGKPPWK